MQNHILHAKLKPNYVTCQGFTKIHVRKFQRGRNLQDLYILEDKCPLTPQ